MASRPISRPEHATASSLAPSSAHGALTAGNASHHRSSERISQINYSDLSAKLLLTTSKIIERCVLSDNRVSLIGSSRLGEILEVLVYQDQIQRVIRAATGLSPLAAASDIFLALKAAIDVCLLNGLRHSHL